MDRLDGQYEHALRVTRLLRDAKPPRDDPSGCDAAGGHVFFNPTHLCWHVLARMLVAKVSTSESGQDLKESASIPHFAKTQSGFTTMGAFYDEIGAAAATDPTWPGRKEDREGRKEGTQPTVNESSLGLRGLLAVALPSGEGGGGGGARDDSHPEMDELVGAMFPRDDDSSGPSVTVESHDKLLTVLQSNSMGYYHWMVECLPKLAAAMPLLRAQPDIKVLVPCREFAERTAVMLGLAPSRMVRNSPGSVFHCKELYFASFTPNLMPPSALLRQSLLPLLAEPFRAETQNPVEPHSAVEDPRPLVVLIDRRDLRELYPFDALRPRRGLVNHRQVGQ